MHTRDLKVRKTVIRMDPDCAICHAPASMACDCEAKGLEVAVKQAEERMMRSIYGDIRLVLPSSCPPLSLVSYCSAMLCPDRLQCHGL